MRPSNDVDDMMERRPFSKKEAAETTKRQRD